MANQRASNVATPGFDGQASISSGLPGLPTSNDPGDAAVARVADQLGSVAGGFADSQAQVEGRKAGTIAGLDPNWRPSNTPTIRGQAFDQAAQSTYVNNLQTQTRSAVADAYASYMDLPVDQRQPSVLKDHLAKIQGQFEQDHVYPDARPEPQPQGRRRPVSRRLQPEPQRGRRRQL